MRHFLGRVSKQQTEQITQLDTAHRIEWVQAADTNNTIYCCREHVHTWHIPFPGAGRRYRRQDLEAGRLPRGH